MSCKEDFEFFIEQMHENAVKDFQKTQQYQLFREKLDRMDDNCENILAPSEREFVTECFELILDRDGQQELYVYHKGLLDCVNLLKWIGVLS